MRKLSTAVLSAALVLGLLAGATAEAKVYKMNPDERAAALKEKRSKRSKAKKEGKAAPGEDQGGWVEVKPGQGVSKKNRKAKVDEIAKQAEEKGKKKSRHKADEAAAPEKSEKSAKKDKKGKKAAAEEPAVEKKHKGKAEKVSKADKPEKAEKPEKSGKPEKAEKSGKGDKKSAKAEGKKGKKGKRSASHGDKAVGSGFGSERKVSASSAEVRRENVPAAAGQKGDDLSGYSVARPGQDKAPAVPEVRHEIQTGPLDSAKPLGSEQKSSEGRF